MPDTTDNYGLRYPLDSDSIDTAGDIQRLAEDVDGAISIDVDADGRTDFGTDDPPLRLYGADRPDGRGDGDLITAPAGTTYTYVGPDAREAPIMGAHIWFQFSQSGTGWVVMYGATPALVSPYAIYRSSWMEAAQLQAGRYAYGMVVQGGQAGHALGDAPNMGWYYSPTTISPQGNIMLGYKDGAGNPSAVYWRYKTNTQTEALSGMDGDNAAYSQLGCHYQRMPYNSNTTWPTAAPAGSYLVGSGKHLKAIEADIKEVAADPDHPRYNDLQFMREELEALRSDDG